MLTPAMLRRLLLALIALSLVRVFAVESPAMTNTHVVAHSKAAAFIASGRRSTSSRGACRRSTATCCDLVFGELARAQTMMRHSHQRLALGWRSLSGIRREAHVM